MGGNTNFTRNFLSTENSGCSENLSEVLTERQKFRKKTELKKCRLEPNIIQVITYIFITITNFRHCLLKSLILHLSEESHKQLLPLGLGGVVYKKDWESNYVLSVTSMKKTRKFLHVACQFCKNTTCSTEILYFHARSDFSRFQKRKWLHALMHFPLNASLDTSLLDLIETLTRALTDNLLFVQKWRRMVFLKINLSSLNSLSWYDKKIC